MKSPAHFVFLLVEEFSHLAFSCAVEPLRIANLVSETELYQWSFASKDGKSETCSNGSVTLVHHSFENLPKCDRLFVLSGINVANHITQKLLLCLRKERTKGRQIGALCSGAMVLAEMGILKDRKAAIHWQFHDAFLEQYPDIDLVRSVFVADEHIITASGGTATADLMLHLIGREHGEDLAIAVADQMVYNAVREGSADQRISVQSRHAIRNPHLVKAVQIMTDSLESPLSTAEISLEIGISSRQLERLFGRHMNCSPKKHYLDLRIHRAQNLLVQTDQSITQIAMACGFESVGHFSRVYRAKFGIKPSEQSAKLAH